MTQHKRYTDAPETTTNETDGKDIIILSLHTQYAADQATIAQQAEQIKALKQWLGVLLDNVDYTRGACGLTEMVGAVLPKEVIEQSRAALEKE